MGMRTLCLLVFLCGLSMSAWGQVSRTLMVDAQGETVELEVRTEGRLRGSVRSVSESSVVFLEDSGRLRELRLSDIREITVVPRLERVEESPPQSPGGPPAVEGPIAANQELPRAQPSRPLPSAESTRDERLARYRAQQESARSAAPASQSPQRVYYTPPSPRHSLAQANFDKGTRIRNIGIGLTTTGAVASIIGYSLYTSKGANCDFSDDYSYELECNGKMTGGLAVGLIGSGLMTAGVPMIIAGGIRRGVGARQLEYGDSGRRYGLGLVPDITTRSVGARMRIEF